jgi:hypothetical protein
MTNQSAVEKPEENQLFQNIFLHLSDKRIIQASVPAFCFTEEELKNLSVDKVSISKPQPLPKGASFS